MNIVQTEKKIVNQDSVFRQGFLNIVLTYQWSNQQTKLLLAPYDITHQQFNILRILKDQYPSNSTLSSIRSKIVDQMSDVSRLIDRLIFKGYVVKKINSYDKRAAAVMITEKGLSILKKVEREVDFSALFSGQLTVEEATQLNVLLAKARGSVTTDDDLSGL